MIPDDLATAVFDPTLYAATPGQKIKRSAQLGVGYYFRALPRYLAHRGERGLPRWDGGAFLNPLRELHPRAHRSLPLPPHYRAALEALRDAGVRLSMPQLRLEGLLGAWWETRDVAGAVIECGAYRGATGLMLAVLGRMSGIDRPALLLDTFRGSPAPGEHDHMRQEGDYAPGDDWARVLAGQAAALGVAGEIEIHEGLFADTFAALAGRADLAFAFVHVDANTYSSTLEACRFTLERAAPGAGVVFDDYNGVLDLGARLAIDECLAATGATPEPLAWCSAYVRVGEP